MTYPRASPNWKHSIISAKRSLDSDKCQLETAAARPSNSILPTIPMIRRKALIQTDESYKSLFPSQSEKTIFKEIEHTVIALEHHNRET